MRKSINEESSHEYEQAQDKLLGLFAAPRHIRCSIPACGGRDERNYLIAAAVLIASGIVSSVLLEKRDATAWQTALGEHEQSWKLQHNAEVESFFGGLNGIESEITSLWVKQIETGRSQTEQAMVELTVRFSGIVNKLDETVKASSLSAETLDNDQGLVAVFNRSETQLQSVIESLLEVIGRGDKLLGAVGNLVPFIDELKGMATSVANISEQTNLLALNAAIEAAAPARPGADLPSWQTR